jgi:hypothetical protein
MGKEELDEKSRQFLIKLDNIHDEKELCKHLSKEMTLRDPLDTA